MVAASLFVGGCSGNLSGDFYYTTRGGDVKRLADREIALVKASDQFDSEWRKAVTDFQAAFQVAYESKDTGSQALQDRVVEEWTAHALKLIAWGKVKIVRTDANGHYDMSGLKPGRYYLFARADLPVSMNIRVPFHWWVQVEIKSGTNTVNLTTSDRGKWPFSALQGLRSP